MAKKNGKLVKKITIDKLAEIINDGFNGQTEYMEKKFAQIATKGQVQGLETRMTSVEKRLGKVEENLGEVRKVLTDARVL